ncbi:peptidase U61 LD-carboxypeptidase A [Synechocystis sp. LKSZ1]
MVISSSGALREHQALEAGLQIWRDRGYRVDVGPHWQAQEGYLAGTDTQRREALALAWSDPDCQGILCSRGGYGSMRLLEQWQWPATTPLKWLIGFSDVTGLLWSLATHQIMALHGPVLTTLAQEPEDSLEHLFACLEGRELSPLQGRGWGGDKVTGPLIPANLTVATHLLATPLQPHLQGAILALEDVTEAPYRIDRLLTQWRLSGQLSQLAGIALGRFSRCQAPAGYSSWPVEQVLQDRLGDLTLSIVSDLPFGHDGPNLALPVGAQVELDGQAGTLRWL